MADIIKLQRRGNFTIVQNEIILDVSKGRLSLKAMGLMTVIFSRPEGWDFSVAGLAAFCRCGKDAIRSALGELEAAGYIERHRQHSENGRFAGNLYIIRDYVGGQSEPEETPSSDFPTMEDETAPSSEKPTPENPTSENPTESNKDLKKDYTPPITPPGGCRRRRSESKETTDWMPERFEAFWKFWRSNVRPGKNEDRQLAIREWDKLRPDDALVDKIALALRRQLRTEEWQNGIGIPYAGRYLRNRRWEDAPEDVSPRERGTCDAPSVVVRSSLTKL